ncbi:hypothetical protein CT19431_160327 [Cupriavidus taiwanensis]|nr:hypothetical protein CT19431_160327 [Cupriavidus taiwanensis]
MSGLGRQNKARSVGALRAGSRTTCRVRVDLDRPYIWIQPVLRGNFASKIDTLRFDSLK